MPKFEYQHVTLPWRARDCVETLNKLGVEGWEVIQLAAGVDETNQAWLKRSIPDDSESKKPPGSQQSVLGS